MVLMVYLDEFQTLHNKHPECIDGVTTNERMSAVSLMNCRTDLEIIFVE